jgi:hypothetical protein
VRIMPSCFCSVAMTAFRSAFGCSASESHELTAAASHNEPARLIHGLGGVLSALCRRPGAPSGSMPHPKSPSGTSLHYA